MKLSTLLIASVLLAHASLGQAAQSKLITNLNAGLNQTLVVYGTSLTQNGRRHSRARWLTRLAHRIVWKPDYYDQ
jgi:hypothetical protein